MKLSTGQKKELKGMLTFLVASIIVWLLASLVLHFPWNHTLILTALSVVISIIQTAFHFNHSNSIYSLPSKQGG